MTSYKLNHFTMADAKALAGKTADITEWADDELTRKVTYPAARIIGIIDRIGPYLLIETAGAEMTDAQTGTHLGTRPPEPELTIGFTWICEVTNVRDQATQAAPAPQESTQASGQPGYQRGDRIVLEHTTDPYTRLKPGDQGTVTGYDPRQGQLHIRWDSGSTLTMLPGEGDQVRLLTPAPGSDGDGTEPEDPLAVRAAQLGRDAGKAAATWVFDGNTPDNAYRRVLRGVEDGDPAVLDAIEPPVIGPAAGYDQDDLARDLGLEPGDPALQTAASAYADAFTGSFWAEVERAAREHTS